MYTAAHFHGKLPHIDIIAKILLAIIDTTNESSILESQCYFVFQCHEQIPQNVPCICYWQLEAGSLHSQFLFGWNNILSP